jgi:hypothetical protein
VETLISLEEVAREKKGTYRRSNLGHTAHSLVPIITELSRSFSDYYKTESGQEILVTE